MRFLLLNWVHERNPMTETSHISRNVPLSRLTMLFTKTLVMTLYVSDKLFWLVGVGSRRLNGNARIGIKGDIFDPRAFFPWSRYSYLINRKLTERHTVTRDQFMVGVLCRLCGFGGQGNRERKGSERKRPQLKTLLPCSRLSSGPCTIIHRYRPSVPWN
jgi:hypothetical protein